MEANWVSTLIIGAILSIPISILANIMTPTFQKWFDKRARTAYSKSLAELKKEYEQIKIFKEKPASFQFVINEFLIKGVIVLCLLGLGMAYFMLLYIFDNFHLGIPLVQADTVKNILGLLSTIAWLLVLAFMASIMNGLINLLSKYSRLKQFEKYENETLTKMKELEKNTIEQSKKSRKI
jgi:hypothetical protein